MSWCSIDPFGSNLYASNQFVTIHSNICGLVLEDIGSICEFIRHTHEPVFVRCSLFALTAEQTITYWDYITSIVPASMLIHTTADYLQQPISQCYGKLLLVGSPNLIPQDYIFHAKTAYTTRVASILALPSQWEDIRILQWVLTPSDFHIVLDILCPFTQSGLYSSSFRTITWLQRLKDRLPHLPVNIIEFDFITTVEIDMVRNWYLN